MELSGRSLFLGNSTYPYEASWRHLLPTKWTQVTPYKAKIQIFDMCV